MENMSDAVRRTVGLYGYPVLSRWDGEVMVIGPDSDLVFMRLNNTQYSVRGMGVMHVSKLIKLIEEL